ncbi:MAG: D-aminoacyl-tRNA deacylase [Negativicutes bacterium]
MRAVVMRVKEASVTINGEVRAQIGKGLLVLLGVAPKDTEKEAAYLADRITGVRIFADDLGKMNLNLAAVSGALLVVSQFTLYADLKSRRPGFTKAAKPETAAPLYEVFMAECRKRGFTVEQGEFGADMRVASVNDGPVTLLFDTDTKTG